MIAAVMDLDNDLDNETLIVKDTNLWSEIDNSNATQYSGAIPECGPDQLTVSQ